MRVFSKVREAQIFAFSPPSIMELGQAKGFDFQLVDQGGVGHAKLMEARNMLFGMVMKDMASEDPTLAQVRPSGMEDVPEYRLDVDWKKPVASEYDYRDSQYHFCGLWFGLYQ
jgi:HAE1 family hydrophobic/amphiphilic exporter-1